MIYILLSFNIILLVLGQTLWKMGMTGANIRLNTGELLKIFTNPFIAGGMVIYALATVIWLYILSKEDLSLVYPLQSLCYVAAAFAAMFIFKEYLPLTRWVGMIFIIVGAAFVSIK